MGNNTKLIYINDDIRAEANFMSYNFIDQEDKNRVYINALGAESLINHLIAEGFDIKENRNIHSISRVLSKIDISDIILPNVHIDVRVVFDENLIFIPKIHAKFGIEPDVYVVLKLGSNFDNLEFLGYFEPAIIDKSRQNDKYYFIENEKLSTYNTFLSFIRNFKKVPEAELSEAEMLIGREYSISLADYDISDDSFKTFLNLLIRSPKLRDAVLEFDNFETLAHKTVNYLYAGDNNGQNQYSEHDNSTKQEDTSDSSFAQDEKPESEEQNEEETIENNDLESDIFDIKDDIALSDNPDNIKPEITEQEENKDSDDNFTGELVKTGLDIAGTIAANTIGAEIDQATTVSKEAMELAAIAGNMIDEVADSTLSSQYKNIDNVDQDKVAPAAEIQYNASEEVIISEDDLLDIEINEDVFGDSQDLNTNFSDLDHAEQNDTYADLMAENESSTFNLEDLPQSENEVMTDENYNDEATNFEDLPIIESEERFDQNIDEDLNNLSDIELPTLDYQAPENITDEDIESDKEEINLEDIITEDQNEINDTEIDYETEYGDNPEEFEEQFETTEDITSPEEEFAQNSQNDESDSQDSPHFTFADGISEDILNDIENKQNESDYFTFGNEDNEEPQEVFNLTDDEDWDKIGEMDGAFEDDTTSLAQTPNEGAQTYSLEDTDYDNTNNSYIETDQDPDYQYINSEDKSNIVSENSISISDTEFNPGEIAIDINNTDQDIYDETQPLENLYNESNNIHESSVLNNNARFSKNSATMKKNSPTLAIAGGVLTLGIIAIVGMSAMKFFKPVQQKTQPVTEPQIPQTSDDTLANPETLDIDNKKVVQMNNSETQTGNLAVSQNKELNHPQLSSTSFIDVTKLSWEIPDYVAYNTDFKTYFQSAGKSLKASLSSDLLLATDAVYSKQVRVSVTFDKNGTFKESRIVMSSGSQQVDKIVLQSVNQTLKILKAPSSLGNDESTTAILKISF